MSTPKPRPSQVDRASAYVSKMDPAIEHSGGDAQTFIVACKLVEFGLGDSDALSVLKRYNERCQPPWSESDLVRKIAYARHHATVNPEFCESKTNGNRSFVPMPKREPAWPKLNADLRLSIILRSDVGLSSLHESSPVHFDTPATAQIIPILFPGDPLICAGMDNNVFATAKVSELGDLSRRQFIVPNPMSKPFGRVKCPKPGRPAESAHTLENTGPRRYAVIEFDSGSADDHACLLWELSSYCPFVMAVHSGGKSLHGWFFVEGQLEEKIKRFYRYAVSLGADHATYLKSQFVRMPDGRRKNGNPQLVYYFNPKPLEKLCPKN